ncbi:hypothetical protein [Acinetobacter baumannii]|uniref:hypothetical protein n=1 Tax=Acinetobacter baumannii TaxID=470 RepID=UPI0002BB9EFB|nr:hypothetical protein [Acinetobacter baumannii]RSP34176.1 hypothetical protein EA732_09945 [Acinetobacter baumannii]
MLNRSVNQVANGRRLAARRVVMNALASIPAQIWRKEVIFNNPAEDSKLNRTGFVGDFFI